VDDADEKYRALVVLEAEGFGLWRLRVAESLDPPLRLAGSRDEQGDAAGREGVMMPSTGPAAEEGNQDIDGEDDEGSADQAFADGIEGARDAEVEEDNCAAEHRDGDGVAERVEQAEPHAFAPRTLHTGDVSDGGKVVVVEAVTQPEKSAGYESEFERRRHRHLLGYGCRPLAARLPVPRWRTKGGGR